MAEDMERSVLLQRLVQSFAVLADRKADAAGIAVDITISTKDMFYFCMRHNYACFSGVFSLFISLGALLVLILRYGYLDGTGRLLLLLVALLFTVVQPLQLFFKAANQVHANPMFREPIRYVFREDGLSLSQNGQTGFLAWNQVMKIVDSSAYFIIYVTRIRAYIFPKDQIGDPERIRGHIRRYCR